MHNIETSRPLVIGRLGPCLFAYATRAVVVIVNYCTPERSLRGPVGFGMEARERCGFDQSSMRSGCDSTPREIS